MLLAGDWSEVGSLDLGEKKVIFPSLICFISKYAYYVQATIRELPQMQRKNVKSLLSSSVCYSFMLFLITVDDTIA